MHRNPAARFTALACAAACVGLLAAGCASAADQRGGTDGVVISTPRDTSPYHGAEVSKYHLPGMTLASASGQRFNLATDTDRPVTLVFFGYTNCPDVCPTTVANVTQAMRQTPEPVRDKVQFVFITTDPARDTKKVLGDWLGRFNRSYIGLTGDLGRIKRVAKDLGVPLSGKEKLPSGGYLVGHGSQVIAFGPDGQSRLLWTAGTPVGALRDDIVHLVQKTEKS